MPNHCELLSTCGFFEKYSATRDLACRGFIAKYCKGPYQDRCERKKYRAKYGAPPPDEMMPSGHMMRAA